MSRFVTFVTEWPKGRVHNKSDQCDVIARNASDISPLSHRIIFLIITHRLLRQPAQFWIPFSTPLLFPSLIMAISNHHCCTISVVQVQDTLENQARNVAWRSATQCHLKSWCFFPPSNDEVSDAFQRYSFTTLNSAAFLGPDPVRESTWLNTASVIWLYSLTVIVSHLDQSPDPQQLYWWLSGLIHKVTIFQSNLKIFRAYRKHTVLWWATLVSSKRVLA